jgi:uncharacterized protein YjbI with pentapeptide repeats
MRKASAILIVLLTIISPIMAAQKKISELPSASSPQVSDFFPIVSSSDGQTKKMTITQLINMIDTGIADGEVTTDKLAALAVTTAKIADSNVTTAKIADSNVTTAKIATGAITNTKIAAGNVTATEIASNAVTTTKIADSNVTTAKIADANVTTAKIADSNVTTAKIADSNVTTAKIADSNVTTAKINDSAVTTAKIADSNVTENKLATGSVTTTKIADSSVTTAKIQNGSITQAKRAALGQQISNDSVAYSTSSSSYVDVTNLSVTITTTGRPVMLMLQGPAAGGTMTNQVRIYNSSSATTSGSVAFVRDAVTLSEILLQSTSSGTSIYNAIPVGAFTCIDVPSAGTYTYKVQAKITAGTAIDFTRVRLIAFEL